MSNTTSYSLVLEIVRNSTRQTINGFGGAFTDAAGINIASLPLAAQENLLQSYYSTEGIQYTIGRIPMASCDFSTHPYSYDDTDGDLQLSQFTLAPEDIKYKIPYIQRALTLSQGKAALVFGSPWSAPAWMKTNKNMTGNGTLMVSQVVHTTILANYFVRFVQEYAKHNISLWGLTAQNEPTDGKIYKFPFQAMGWTPETQRDFIKLDLGPALHANGFQDIKLMILDDDRLFLPEWGPGVLSDPEAKKYISGVAVHWYLDTVIPLNVLDFTHDKFPDTFLFATEACCYDCSVSFIGL
ncbi:glucosylceramidase-like [Pomacea canaliculata]|uniref:glucosylceramidase-like n=1 Tax=Pomacea canaliculata TaxID=400727 RepID=UPI000D73BFB4|nr:glucosylceramidase-like [Pomacea canaliculata]